MGEFGRVEAVVGNVHGLWTVANDWPQGIEGVRFPVLTRGLKGLVPPHEFGGTFPDQDTHPARTFFGLQHLAQPADVAHISQGIHEGGFDGIEHDEEYTRHDGQDPHQPGHPEPSPDQPPDGKEDEYSSEEAEQRATALGVKDRGELSDENDQVCSQQ